MFYLSLLIALYLCLLSALTWLVIGLVLFFRKKNLLQLVSIKKMSWLASVMFLILIVSNFISLMVKPLPGFITPELVVMVAFLIIYPIFFGIFAPILYYFALVTNPTKSAIYNPLHRYSFLMPWVLLLGGMYFSWYYAINCDLADGMSYFIIVVSIILTVFLLNKSRSISWLRTAVVIFMITSIYVMSSDRLLGYDKINSDANSTLFFAISCLVIVWCWVRQKHKFAILCVAIIFLPIVEIPKDLFRQIIGYSLIDWSTTEKRFSNTFITRITSEKIYAIEEEMSSDVVTNYYRSPLTLKYKFRSNYYQDGHFLKQNVFHIHYGGGTMDAQIPNFAPLSLWVLPRIFALMKK